MRTLVKLWTVGVLLILQGTGQAKDMTVSNSEFAAGLRQGASEIRQNAESMADRLDAAYNFASLAENGVLPPVLRAQYGPQDIDAVIKSKSPILILEPARPLCPENYGKSCVPVSWRTFLYAGLSVESESGGIADAGKVSSDHARGHAEAEKIFAANLQNLRRVYEGMILFKGLQAYGVVSPPAINFK